MHQVEADLIEAARGYYEAFFKVSPDLVRQYFLPCAIKVGAMYDYEHKQFQSSLMEHNFQQIVVFASQYNASGHMPATEPGITVLDVQDRTAIVKVSAEWATDRWGTDYVALARVGERWMIASVVWQSSI
jgi:hypothetical protein